MHNGVDTLLDRKAQYPLQLRAQESHALDSRNGKWHFSLISESFVSQRSWLVSERGIQDGTGLTGMDIMRRGAILASGICM